MKWLATGLFAALFLGALCADKICPEKIETSLQGGFDDSSGKCLILHKLEKEPIYDNKYIEAMRFCFDNYRGVVHSVATLRGSGGKYFADIDKKFYELIRSHVGSHVLNGLRFVNKYMIKGNNMRLSFRHTNNSDVIAEFARSGNSWSSKGLMLLTEEALNAINSGFIQFPTCLTMRIGNNDFNETKIEDCQTIGYERFFCQMPPLDNCELSGTRCVCKAGFTGKYCNIAYIGRPEGSADHRIFVAIAVIGILCLIVLAVILSIVYHRRKIRDKIIQRQRLRKQRETQKALQRFAALEKGGRRYR